MLNNSIFINALNHINTSLNNNFYVVFATTNYQAGGLGFLKELFDREILNKKYLKQIFVSGTHINWEDKTVSHFNMDENKIKGICYALKISSDVLIKNLDSCYGDDPNGNDKAILNLSPKAYVIQNDKKKYANIASHIIRTNWEEINKLYL